MSNFHEDAGYVGTISIDSELDSVDIFIPENKIVNQPEKLINYSFDGDCIVKRMNGEVYETQIPDSIYRLCISCDFIFEANKSNYPLALSKIELDDKRIKKFDMSKLSKRGDKKIEETVADIDKVLTVKGRSEAVQSAIKSGLEEEYNVLLGVLNYGIGD